MNDWRAGRSGRGGQIMLQLLLPFVLGHLSRPWIDGWVARNKKGWIAKTDQTAYSALLGSAKRWSTASGTKSAGIAAVYRRGQPHTVGDRHRH